MMSWRREDHAAMLTQEEFERLPQGDLYEEDLYEGGLLCTYPPVSVVISYRSTRANQPFGIATVLVHAVASTTLSVPPTS